MGEACHGQCPRPGLPGYGRTQVRLLSDAVSVVVPFRRAKNPDGLLIGVASRSRGGDDRSAAAVGDQAAVEEVERPGDPSRFVVVLEGHGVLHEGLGI